MIGYSQLTLSYLDLLRFLVASPQLKAFGYACLKIRCRQWDDQSQVLPGLFLCLRSLYSLLLHFWLKTFSYILSSMLVVSGVKINLVPGTPWLNLEMITSVIILDGMRYLCLYHIKCKRHYYRRHCKQDWKTACQPGN